VGLLSLLDMQDHLPPVLAGMCLNELVHFSVVHSGWPALKTTTARRLLHAAGFVRRPIEPGSPSGLGPER
jgi:hypothetical protein